MASPVDMADVFIGADSADDPALQVQPQRSRGRNRGRGKGSGGKAGGSRARSRSSRLPAGSDADTDNPSIGSVSDDGFSDLLSMAGDGDQPGDAVCWVCSEGATEQEPIVRQGTPGIMIHPRCLGAKRAVDSSKGLSDKEKKKLDDLRKNDQPAYKAMIMKTRAPVGARRGGDERAKLKKVMQEFLSYSTVERVKPRLLLNEVRFIQWHKVNEGLDDAAATQKWIDSRSNPSVYREWEDGELVLAVKGNTEINGIEGASNVNKSGNQMNVDNDQQMAAMLNQRAAFTHDAFSGVGGKALSAHAAVVPSSGPGSASSGSDNTSMGRAGAQDLLAGLFASASAPCGIAPTNSPQEPHTPNATGNAAGIINVGSSSESLETSPQKVADDNDTQVTKMTDSQFYKAKRALVSELEALLTTHNHKKSLQAQLKDLIATFRGPECGEAQILKDLGTEDKLDTLDKLITTVESVLTKTKTCAMLSFPEIKAEVEALISNVNVTVTILNEHVATLNEEKNLQARLAKKRKESGLYHARKKAEWLAKGGGTPGLAKGVAKAIIDYSDVPKGTLIDPQELTPTKISVFTKRGGQPLTDNLTRMIEVATTKSDLFDFQCSKLSTVLEKLPAHRSAMGLIGGVPEKMQPALAGTHMPGMHVPGDDLGGLSACSYPWALVVQPKSLRHGFYNWPLPAMACLVTVSEGDATLLLINCKCLMDGGCSLVQNVPAFLDANPKCLQDVWTMKLNPNQLVWVPPGFYPLLVTEDVGAKLLIWPWLVPAVYKDIPLDEFLFVYAGAEEFVQKQEKAPWIQIKEPLLQFREQICSTDQLAQFLSATATRAKASTEKEAASGPASVVEVIGAKKTSAASAKPAVETDGPKEDKSS